MLQQEQQARKEHNVMTEPLNNRNDTDEEEEEEEDINYKRPQKKCYSTTPEPTIIKKTRDPNRKDKIGRTKIFQATTAGHLDKVKELVEQGANVNFKDNANWTPLHEAANNGRYEIIKYLLSCGAEINVRGYGLDTPLHDACQSNSKECIQLLVDAGADVFALNEKNQRPIDLCTTESCKLILTTKMKKLDHIMKRNNSTGRTLLHEAILNHDFNRVKELVQHGADVNAQDNQKSTPLHLACSKGYLNIVKLLLEQGALINQMGTEYNETPLHQASRFGHEQVVRYLIQHTEVNVNMENKSGKNAYDVAASYPPTVRQLLTARMDELRFEKEACNALDDTARKLALQAEPERQLTREERKIQSYMKVFAKLENNDDPLPLPSSTTTKRKRKTSSRKSASVERDLSAPNSPRKPSSLIKLDPFKKDTSGGTQLHKYAGRGDIDAVLQLLENGARPNESDYAGWTALHEAALKGHIEVVKILLKYGANPNVKGGDLDTPLHDATENNHCDIVELLLEHGADPFARNINNAEPIDIAMHHEFDDIILVLQSANPVKKKKRSKVIVNKVEEEEQETIVSKPLSTKKRRLIRAADSSEDEGEQSPVVQKPLRLKKLRQRSSSPDLVPVKVEQEIKEKENLNHTMTTLKKSYSPVVITPPKVIDNNQVYHHQHHYHHHSPIHTPPPEQWNNKKSHSPLYFIQQQQNLVVDLQVSLFLGFNSLNDFWNQYSTLFQSSKKLIHAEIKSKLWPTIKSTLNEEEKSTFMSKPLYFIPLQEVLNLIKLEYHHLLENLLTVHLDVEDTPVTKKLPPKIAMKLKKCGYKFPA